MDVRGVARWIQARAGSLPPVGRHGPAGAGEPQDEAARLEALRALADGIGTTLDEGTTCAELTRAAVRLAGGAAAVLRRGEHGATGYEAAAGTTDALPDARWAAAAVREAQPPTAGGPPRPWTGRPPGSPGLTVLCVALTSGADRYGVLVAARRGSPFTRTEAERLALLAERAASHIRHARSHELVDRTAGDLQRALLAEPGRPHPNLHVAIRYLPSGSSRVLVGGDWCETVRLHFGRTLLVVGDVMGHGLEAAVDMSAYRSALRYIASADLPPHRVLRQLDDIAAGEGGRRPATCLLARADPGRGRLTLSSAGHLPPLLIDGDGRAALLGVPVGPPLGTGFGGYESATHELAPGQTLVLFTDGLVERRGEDIDSSLARLAALRFTPGDGVDHILDTILARLDARHAEDDVAVLAARPQPRHGHLPEEAAAEPTAG
ncbi:GAF domain-containing protein [Streptomyces collinus]|uniref:Magnesium or manganese-dependent protein phosphatase n=1 Tax=Streptomyces collinus (strain DSM 40733 / Tue 365) TaxID=1214242 RepID=S5UYV4_STRC3|nr:magnesium or manganese-dependent protein phosphatase [Streptomyces collinus Tu 365]UJA11149.1 GAF domain-containing protein [Streptomyces collinus]UJA13986.1 GAF domain-containing protein [Streptomyces collinus]